MLSLPRPSPLAPSRTQRSAFTLIEMLVAVAVTMIMMLAIAQIFLLLGTNMDKGRAMIEMSGQLRNVTHRLQQDLNGLTCSTLPWTKADAGDGYFEYIEGAGKDLTAVTTMNGDIDDVIAFTSRSKGKAFAVSHGGGVAESELAEIIWWVHDDGTGNRTLCRRIFLIRPDLTGANISTSPKTSKANSLSDLTYRENRSLHAASPFPHVMSSPGAPNTASGEVVLANVVAFDVRAWDPLAPVRTSSAGNLVAPGDPGWATASAVTGAGAYVDLGYAGNTTTSLYSGTPNAKSKLTVPTYSTWPFSLEHDGIDTDGTGGIDQGTNGFDDGGLAGTPDDPGEYETMPPYPHPGPFSTGISPAPTSKAPGLRGIQARIRMHEPSTRQVRQATVVAEFLPE